MKKYKKTILFILTILIVIALCIFLFKKHSNESSKNESGINIVPTMEDNISDDSLWCGTFQLVWNEMKNEFVKGDILFLNDKNNIMVKKLNKELFNKNMISDDHYYIKSGEMNLKLKEEIEKGIKEKFNQESDVLNGLNWQKELIKNEKEKITNYFFYTMLYREFKFTEEFDNLEKGKFANKYNDVEYFGIDKENGDATGKAIDVLYYNSKNDFAIKIATDTNDEVIFCKNPKGKTFKEIYEDIINKAERYEGTGCITDSDEFKAPKLSFNEKREYAELENKKFETTNPKGKGIINKAIQTIKFDIDEKGGKIKSEAFIDMKLAVPTSYGEEPKENPRYFYLDDTFALFLKEKEKDTPYFAAKINDITKFK